MVIVIVASGIYYYNVFSSKRLTAQPCPRHSSSFIAGIHDFEITVKPGTKPQQLSAVASGAGATIDPHSAAIDGDTWYLCVPWVRNESDTVQATMILANSSGVLYVGPAGSVLIPQ